VGQGGSALTMRFGISKAAAGVAAAGLLDLGQVSVVCGALSVSPLNVEGLSDLIGRGA
jgi:hypothetical protein